MAVKKFNTRIQLKHDVADNGLGWLGTGTGIGGNLVLLGGEFAWDSTNKNFKIGDGSSTFANLNYAIPVANGTEITSTVINGYPTLAIGSIDGSKINALTGYTTDGITGNVAATDTLEQALAKIENKVDSAIGGGITGITMNGASVSVTDHVAALGNQVTTFGGASGAITLGTHLSMDGQQLKTDATGTGTLATTGDITTAIASLDVTAITGNAGQTITSISETDGVISATYSNISITSSQISDKTDAYASDGQVVVTGSAISNALATLDGSHDVATAGAYTATSGESATYKLDIFDATETDGIVSTNQTASETLYFSQSYSASNPILTKADIGSLSGAMHFKDIVNSNTDLPSSGQVAGDVYIVGTAGTYAGQECEVGDMIIWNGSAWTIVTGENQVTNLDAELVAGGALVDVASVDGVVIKAKTSVTAGSATIASKSGNIVTIKTGVTQGTGTGTIANDNGTDITLAAVATTGSAADVSIADSDSLFTASDVEGALAELKGDITNANITIDGHKGAITTGNGLTDVASDGGSFGIQIKTGSANGLTVDASGLAYEHNTTAINIASEDSTTHAVVIKGTLTPDVADNITLSGDITLAPVAVTGSASNVSVSTASLTSSNVNDALQELAEKIENGTDGLLITTNTSAQTPGSESMSDDINLHKIAKTANPADLVQPSGDMIIFDCGNASTNIASDSGAISPDGTTPNPSN